MHQPLNLLRSSGKPHTIEKSLGFEYAYCVIVIEMLVPCWPAEPDGPAVEETVT